MSRIAEQADRLWEARESGDHCPPWLVGTLDLDEALDLQLEMLSRRQQTGEELAGWKVGLTSERAREALGVDERPFGYLLAGHALRSGATIDASSIRHPSIEAEMCFTIGATLAGRPQRSEVIESLDRVSAGFEVNERRAASARPDFGAMVTDCLTNWGIVEGGGVAVGDAAGLNGTTVRLERNGEEVFVGLGGEHVDDHVESLRRLVTTLDSHGRVLEAGQKVITGAFCRFDTRSGDHWRATYADIGEVEVSFR